MQLEKDYPIKKKRAKPRKFDNTKAPRLVCYHLERNNICGFVSNDTAPCQDICPNWCTFNVKFIRSWGRSKNVKREYMDWSDLMHSPKYKAALADSEYLIHKGKRQQVLI